MFFHILLFFQKISRFFYRADLFLTGQTPTTNGMVDIFSLSFCFFLQKILFMIMEEVVRIFDAAFIGESEADPPWSRLRIYFANTNHGNKD